jgi:hypothetical protein
MALPNVYVQVYGQLQEFFKKIQDGQAPSKFSQQHLKDIGFTSTNHRAFIPLLKALGFLSPDGSPTARYHEYRDPSQARKVMGDALKDAYSDLFVIKANPTEKDKDLIEGKFKSVHNAKNRPAELMARTFFSLLKHADLTNDTKSFAGKKDSKHAKDDQGESVQLEVPEQPFVSKQVPIFAPPGLHYNIQIHLPATKDIEVYSAIFKSLKENLLG